MITNKITNNRKGINPIPNHVSKGESHNSNIINHSYKNNLTIWITIIPIIMLTPPAPSKNKGLTFIYPSASGEVNQLVNSDNVFGISNNQLNNSLAITS